MDPSLELRKLATPYIRELSQILEYAESWKRLMSIIPKTLEKDKFQCDIRPDNLPKYNSEHFKIIENVSEVRKIPCSEILFQEWGCSGRYRATLGHLLYLLTKAELFRAADYVAVSLLKQEPPKRPNSGPAARVVTDVGADQEAKEIRLKQMEKILDEINYPSSIIENLQLSSFNENLDYSGKVEKVVPRIIVDEVTDDSESTLQNGSVSDMIKFSTDSVSTENNVTHENSSDVPKLSQLLNTENDDNSSLTLESNSSKSYTSEVIPEISVLLESEAEIIPNLSELNAQDPENSLPLLSAFINNSTEIPRLSSLGNTDSSGDLPNLDVLIDNSTNPLSVLLPTISTKSKSSTNSTKSRQCSSPLPNLSLNTHLPHYSYQELEAATNDFNENKFTSKDGVGRFLGSGAYGSVFLALGLLDRPIAVKKLMLENEDVVNVDDRVTKQFRNEVEVLSKYKHEHLLSLLGYSCDGCTYCLMYEYVSGGALKDRLQRADSKLTWMERMDIALGTSRAVSYLHTAFSTPLIHRDIKTSNILLEESNKPKLCDFGLIKLTPNQNTSTGTTVFGTSAYMAPEAFAGDISVKLDTFSFGVVLLELLTSLPPLDETRDGCDLVTHVEDKCEDSIAPLLDTAAGSWSSNGVDYAAELYKIALQCLEKKKKRPLMEEVTLMLTELMKNL